MVRHHFNLTFFHYKWFHVFKAFAFSSLCSVLIHLIFQLMLGFIAYKSIPCSMGFNSSIICCKCLPPSPMLVMKPCTSSMLGEGPATELSPSLKCIFTTCDLWHVTLCLLFLSLLERSSWLLNRKNPALFFPVSLWPATSGYRLGVKGNYFFPGCQVFSRKLPYRYAPYIHKDNCKNTAIIELVGMARIFGTALASLKRGLASWIAVHNGVQYSCLKESFCRNSHGVPQLLGSVCRSTLSWRAELIPFKKNTTQTQSKTHTCENPEEIEDMVALLTVSKLLKRIYALWKRGSLAPSAGIHWKFNNPQIIGKFTYNSFYAQFCDYYCVPK
jgi:hypothetical protein